MAFNATRVTADGVAITKSDSTNLSLFGFYVGGAGDVTIKTLLGTSLLFTAVPAGTTIRIGVSKIMSTGTTATSIVGLGPT